MRKAPACSSIVAVSLACLLLPILACSDQPSPPAAKAPAPAPAPVAHADAIPPEIQIAVESYLRDAKGLDPSKMNITLSEFSETENGGTCKGAITLREGGDMPPMEYEYTLVKGEQGWSVTASSPKGGMGHATMPPMGTMPEGHPAVGGTNPHEGVPGAPPLASGHGSTEKGSQDSSKK